MSATGEQEKLEQEHMPIPFMAETPDTNMSGTAANPVSPTETSSDKLRASGADHNLTQEAAQSEHFEKRSRMSSRHSHRSIRTNSSRSSITSTKAALAAEAAALKAQLEFADAEAEKRAEIEKNHAELAKLQTMRNLCATQARIRAIDTVLNEEFVNSDIEEIGEVENRDTMVREYVQSLPNCHDNAGLADESPPLSGSEHQANSDEIPEKPKNSTLAGDDRNDLSDLAKVFANQLNLSRLPPPEPGVFSGDPLKYPSWRISFETLIEKRGVPPSERLHYLKRYLTGPAKEAVDGFLILSSDDAFDQAKALLQKRYGDPFVIANAFRDKLDTWPKIAPRDGKGLRNLADFLRQCESAMKTNENLNILNDDRENRKLLAKLPDWLVPRWGRKAQEWKEKHNKSPPYTEFVKFVVKEADLACDPVTSLQSLKAERPSSESTKQDARSARKESKRAAGASTFSTATETKRKGGFQDEVCLLCEKRSHQLDDCRSFLSKTLEERKQFVMKRGLCFACLTQGHRSKQCRQRKTCQTCKRRHPTSLHGDVKETPAPNPKPESEPPKPVVASTSSHTRVNNFSDTCVQGKSSMIVPVWVSHSDTPNQERLVYALLDTQSDTTFILDDTCDALGLDGPKVQLLLSTMFSSNQRVESRKIRGLQVRGYDSNLRITLPTAYTRGIMPANRTHIPTADMARRWPHLDKIARELMPVADCEVGILIGYNCPQALAPREVIAPVDNEPYGQRTDLGWGIIGIVDPDLRENESDQVGVSHRILACENPTTLSKAECQVGMNTVRDQVLLAFRTHVKEVIKPSGIVEMMELDFSERKSCDVPVSIDDRKFMKKMQEGIRQQPDGHYIMPLPFKGTEPPKLPNNKMQAVRRLDQLKSRFARDQSYHRDYCSFMQDIIENGYAERVPESEVAYEDSGHVWYIPHHGVYHTKKPEKIRVVFDCSARYHGVCLNDHLLQGPDLTNALVGVLCRFRREPVALICDVEKMFYQFQVDAEHRNFLRFLWWSNGCYEGDPHVFRMKVHLFGATSSPGCANFGLRQIADDFETECGSAAANFVRRNFYVDDGLISVPTKHEATDLIQKTKDLCKRGGLRLHKFVSNSVEVIDAVALEDRAKGIKDLDLRFDSLPVERALGIQWCIESDTFQFRITLKDQPLTKRGVLSTVCSVYDPLGLVAPVVLVGKQILQSLCKDQADWDDPLPDPVRSRWEQWRSSLIHLQDLKVSRCFRPEDFGDVKSIEVHHFSDASNTGYAQCSYLRLQDTEGRVHCALVMGKCRVCPLKTVTIPRLELNAAVVSVRVSALLQKELDYKEYSEVFWTDSQVVLGYIANDARRFHTFVANRVQQIRDQTEPNQWRHVRSEANPADDGSRGLCANELVNQSRWLHGPAFLQERDIPIEIEACSPTVSSDDPEVKKVQAFSTHSSPKHSMLERLERFSQWHRVKGAVAICLKLKQRLKARLIKRGQTIKPIQTPQERPIPLYEPATVEELYQSEVEIIRLLQRHSFAGEMKILESLDVSSNCVDRQTAGVRNKAMRKTSCLYRLDPFIDEDGVMRVGGRIKRADLPPNFKHPAILPRNHHITDLIIRHCHEVAGHQGRSMTTNQIRSSGYWIIGCSSAVSSIISKCVKCRKLYKPVIEQKMANLPEDRLEPAPPFTYCGVDLFGPWYIKEGRKELKRYGVLFTCMSSRAIHIETTTALSTDVFINALRRFIAIRGPIRQLRCDQGTNFVGTRSELNEALKEMNTDHVRKFLIKQNCDLVEFKTNIPTASHTGGVWERQIRSVRRVLSSLMDQLGSHLDDESLRTLMTEAAAIINSRPLTIDNLNDPTSLAPLTPNHLLTMKSTLVLPPPGCFQSTDLYSKKRWRRVQFLANEFWNRWRKEYIQTLQLRQKWIRPHPNLEVDDIVLVKDDTLPRNRWQLGRVKDVFPGKDGLVRSARLLLGDPLLDVEGKQTHPKRYLERPVQKLVLLVTNKDTGEFPVEEPK
ncbi:uncharacterized protein LOC110985605 [Acanthaster planci]|uniref:Uncharacterized protein LOC110985605 n=1 Tax=Acanthaster planci TaxID=133434 RepID=A0A8B7ZBS2_ACAPL|nr:uncharacterized protein LOC110985605 [Acanthaster planci]